MSDSERQALALPSALETLLTATHRWVVMTGSGVSAESGVPTFRDAQTGLWEKYDPMELATPDAFSRDPNLVWSWYQWRRGLIAQTSPNAAHDAIAELQQLKPRLTLVTQNVDGLHQRAGSTTVIEFHGSINRNKCFKCEKPGPETDAAEPPRCNECGGLLRPDVVWFGETIPVGALQGAARAVEQCDLFVSAGTSSLVYPAAALAQSALGRNVPIVEVNPNETPLSEHASFVLRGSAAEWLPLIAASARRSVSN